MPSVVTSGMFPVSEASKAAIVVSSLFKTEFYKITFRTEVRTSNKLNMLPLINIIFLFLLTVNCFPVEKKNSGKH